MLHRGLQHDRLRNYPALLGAPNRYDHAVTFESKAVVAVCGGAVDCGRPVNDAEISVMVEIRPGSRRRTSAIRLLIASGCRPSACALRRQPKSCRTLDSRVLSGLGGNCLFATDLLGVRRPMMVRSVGR